jgi:hypothetical protein
MILFRYVLIGLVVYLIVRSFVSYVKQKNPVTSRPESEKMNDTDHKRVSKKIGEYVDYEEIGK